MDARFGRSVGVAGLALLAACAPELRTLAYPDGARYEEAEWRGALRDGRRRNYYADGTLERELAYHRGEPDGRWSYFGVDGTLLQRGDYVAGRRSGEWIENHPSGGPRSRGVYVAGQKDGLWRHWDENGALLYEEAWENGSLVCARTITGR